MKDKKSLISTILLCGGLLLAVCGIFCFFGPAMTMNVGEGIMANVMSVFAFMFGGKATAINSATGKTIGDPIALKGATPALTAVFVIEIIVILLAIIIAVGHFTKKLDTKKIIIFGCVASVLMLVGAILALTSQNAMLIKSMGLTEEMLKFYEGSLGAGLIAYAVLSFVGVAANVAGIILKKKAA